VDCVPAIGLARPALRRSLGGAEIVATDDERDAEGGRRLLAAFLAMADIERQRLPGDRIAYTAALTAAADRFRFARLVHWASLFARRRQAGSNRSSSSAMNALRGRPGSIAGRNSSVMRPGLLLNARRPQKSPEFSATGTTGISRWP